VLRITKDGGIPAGNPFQGAGTARCNVTGGTTAGNKCQETYSWGHRNPFRLAFDPNPAGTRFFINDVGEGSWEEIDLAQAGADFGWNCREGAHTNNTSGPCNPTPPGMVDPIFEYQHGVQVPGSTSSTSCNSITGGAFVPNGIWPATFDNSYLFSDFICGWIFRLAGANGPGPFASAADFATNLGGSSAVDLRFGPFGNTRALYYTTFSGGGQVRRIRYDVAGNNPPTAIMGAVPTAGSAPLLVNFSAAGSSDPDAGNTLTYFWNFGDGSPEVATASTSTMHTYTSTGTYIASLKARDNNFAFSSPVTTTLQVAGPAKGYFAVTPCRLDDTRNTPAGPFGGPALAGGSIRTLPAVGHCGVPSGATAIAANLTVVSSTSPGDLRFFPSGQPVPTVSMINYSTGQVRSNNAVIALSAAGEFDIFTNMAGGASTHLVVDVLGYFQ
jgi:PKD repeat protein